MMNQLKCNKGLDTEIVGTEPTRSLPHQYFDHKAIEISLAIYIRNIICILT